LNRRGKSVILIKEMFKIQSNVIELYKFKKQI